jgi:hypothetical protein
MTHALYAQVCAGVPPKESGQRRKYNPVWKCDCVPSVPKFKTKYREPLALAKAYNPVATLNTQSLAAVLGAYRPIPRMKKAAPYRAKGSETT